VHGGDTEPVRIYAAGGNVTGRSNTRSLILAKPLYVQASGNITDLGIEAQNLRDGDVTRVRAGGDGSVAVSQRRTVYFFGENSDGQSGLGAAVTADLGVATAIALDAFDASLADRFTLYLGSDGLARAAGANEAGSLGDGGTTARSTFAPVTVVANGISIGAGGRSFSAAIAADGTTYTWGDNSAKQLGNSTISTTGTSTPTAIPSFDAVP
jgi:alpha-tubulin suppressor-like RCC1 family protein